MAARPRPLHNLTPAESRAAGLKSADMVLRLGKLTDAEARVTSGPALGAALWPAFRRFFTTPTHPTTAAPTTAPVVLQPLRPG